MISGVVGLEGVVEVGSSSSWNSGFTVGTVSSLVTDCSVASDSDCSVAIDSDNSVAIDQTSVTIESDNSVAGSAIY